MTLDQLEIGKQAMIKKVGGQGALRQHFLDMGVIPGADVKIVKFAPMGDPIEVELQGYELTLRVAEAAQIEVVSQKERRDAVLPESMHKNEKKREGKRREHPGLGEDGKYHNKQEETPLPEDTLLTFALVGNQNCGKTTLFNQLTGSNQHVGNFPGVTVDRKDGVIKGNTHTKITDLPGIYSMSPYTQEEVVSRNFVLQEKPKAIINIVDATNIERNLYLTMQLLEMEIPMVVALNMMDEVVGNGGSIDINEMEHLLGVPVVPISAAKNQGVDELIRHALHVAQYQEKPQIRDFCDETEHKGALHRCLHGVAHLIEDHAKQAEIPLRFAASKVVERDQEIIKILSLDPNEIELIEHILVQLEAERELDPTAALADMRFSYIKRVCAQTVVKPKASKERVRSEKIDRILTGKYTAIPCFVGIMLTVFYLTFEVIGAYLQGLIEIGIEKFSGGLEALLIQGNVNATLQDLLIHGIVAGVGSVLSFIPIIVTLFFFLSLMEDSGYLARVAFFMDKLLRKIGLSGRSMVPLLIGFGCTVPAVMSTRTLPSERDRKMTILLTPFMSCTAKLPIYAFFVSAFFSGKGALIMSGLYFLGIVVGILIALLWKGTIFKGEAVPFVMELPNYRLPGVKNVAHLLWEKAKDFIQKAFTIIFLATIAVWFLQSFDWKMNLVEDSKYSMMASIANLFVPLFQPIGLGDWRICTSLLSGFMAKESIVSTLEVLFHGQLQEQLSRLSALSLLVFSLLYTPCVAAVASIRRELGRLWAASVVIWQSVLAWLVAFGIYMIGNLWLG